MGKLLPTLRARRSPLTQPGAQLAKLHALPMAREFEHALESAGLWPLQSIGIDILQVNVGRLCNQTCRHCHVDAGPDRTEIMSRETFELCLRALEQTTIQTVDITGGAPELNPDFRWFVAECRKLGRKVLNRCNLTLIETPAHSDLPEFFAEHQVEVICSLPHYRALGTDRQRGDGVFEKSIAALRKLNRVGYGQGKGLQLTIVANPTGAFLPGPQASLEAEWKRELDQRYGVQFDQLFTITNMPISRYLEWLEESGNLEGYMEQLVAGFNAAAARGVMCRNILSVGYDGTLYDCDFNQMLELPIGCEAPSHIRDFDQNALETRGIVVNRHCFGCTAGAGSSCSGTTA